MHGEAWATVLALSLAVASASLTITKSPLFAWARAWMQERGRLAALLSGCPYCVSHWLALAGVAWLRPMLAGQGIGGLVVSWFVTVTLAGLMAGLVFRAYAGMTTEDET